MDIVTQAKAAADKARQEANIATQKLIKMAMEAQAAKERLEVTKAEANSKR